MLKLAVGRKFFVVSGEDKSIPNGNLENFTVATRASFHLDPEFELKVQGVDEVYRVKINEKRLYYELFCTRDLFDDLGKEASFVLDFTLNMGGSEAVAESFYSVMETQRFDGGQLNKTLEDRTIIDWCLPHAIACPQTVSEIAKLYKSGDAKLGLATHRDPMKVPLKASPLKPFSKVLNKQFKKAVNSHFK